MALASNSVVAASLEEGKASDANLQVEFRLSSKPARSLVLFPSGAPLAVAGYQRAVARAASLRS
jgi:hypothetical protein